MPQRTLIITECREIHRGRKQTGEEYVVYDVSATREDYTPLHDMKLRSFTALELHVPTAFEVRPYETRTGMTYTLFPKDRSPQSSSQPEANTPQTSQNYGPVIEQMQRRIVALERKIEALTRPQTNGDLPTGLPAEDYIPR